MADTSNQLTEWMDATFHILIPPFSFPGTIVHLGGIVKSATPLHAFKLAYDTRVMSKDPGSCSSGIFPRAVGRGLWSKQQCLFADWTGRCTVSLLQLGPKEPGDISVQVGLPTRSSLLKPGRMQSTSSMSH